MNNYQAIIFDLGNVIFNISFDNMFAYWAQVTGFNAVEIKKKFAFNGMYCKFEKGKIVPGMYRKYVLETLGFQMSEIEFNNGWNNIYLKIVPGIENLLQDLKSKYRLFILTNTNVLHARKWKVKYASVLSNFEKVFCSYEIGARKPYFRLAPFIVGIYESQLENMDHELAHLVEEYMNNGGAVGIMKPQPALHRVIPAQGAVKSEWILPYDDVRAMLKAAKKFSVRDCICRVQQDLLGDRKCDFPLKNCLSFSSIERPDRPGDISQEEALGILDQSEEVGLVHTVSNIIKGVFYVCNCCGCCCGILLGITKWGIEKSVAYANYYVVIDLDKCQRCGICIERCQVNAISEQDGVALVDLIRCIGCGLCVTGCPEKAVKLVRKPDSEIVHPPENFAAWESERLKNRGLKVF